MEARMLLGANLRRAREKLGWSQEELADRAGIHRTYISGVERGTRNPTLGIIEILADTLAMSISQLLKEH